MSQDAIAAVSGASIDPLVAVQRLQSLGGEPVNMRSLGSMTSPPNGSATVQAMPVTQRQATSAMNLQSLAEQFSTGLQHGFYAKDIDRLMHKLDQAHQPDSGVTFGDVTVELLNVQAKVGIADALSKVSSKLSEGLQTLVVKQG